MASPSRRGGSHSGADARRCLAGVRCRPSLILGIVLALALHGASSFGQEAPPAAPPPTAPSVDFAGQIEPILRTHCHQCHGRDTHANGLRLDLREEAMLGGHSGRPVLGGDLESNELYRRVSSDDATYRMPKGADALSSEEIGLIRDWVAAGTPWPDPPPPRKPPVVQQTWWDRVLVHWKGADKAVDAVLKWTEDYRPYFYGLIGLHLAVLLVERGKRLYRAGHPWTQGRFRRLFAACGAFRTSHYLVLILAIALAVQLKADHDRQRLAEQENSLFVERITQLETQIAATTNVNSVLTRVYGDPPTPIRPSHPKRLGGEYYRGNCERGAGLFNGGNYRTATFRIGLCDSGGQPLNVGDSVPAGGLFVRLEIDRAPGTTATLFTEDTMAAVFLSRTVFQSTFQDFDEELVRLRTVRKDWQWDALFSIGQPPTNGGRLQGQIYVYSGNVSKEQIRGERHYSIVYDLGFADGRIAADSDLWMGSLLWNGQLAVPQPGKVPHDEWFDYRPIPEITGENTTDPRLLGIEEHERKRREAEAASQPTATHAPASQAPASESAAP